MAPLILALALLQAPLPPPIFVTPTDQKSVGELVSRGRLMVHRRQYREAIVELTAVISRYPGLEMAWNFRGNAYYGLGDYTSALADQNQAILLNPKFIPAWRDRGATFRKMGDIVAAESDRAMVLRLLKH